MNGLPRRDFALEVYLSKWEFAAKHHLTASDAESMSLSSLLKLATPVDRAAWDPLHLGYTQTHGSPALRAEIARTYERVTTDDVLCFAGAEEAIYAAMHVLLTPSDHAITITPNYQAAETIPLSICEVTGVPLAAADNWDLDPDRLKDALRPNTRVLSINFPNNPTGKILSHETYETVIELCRSRGIWLFSDEVYRLIERDPTIRMTQAVDAYERGISLNVMSKAYGLPGLRIGWLALRDRELLQRLEHCKHFLSICNSAPSEHLALIALKARGQILERTRQLVRDNLVVLDEFFARFPELFDWRRPDGSCVAFVRYRGSDGVEAFTTRLIEEAGVLLLPSSIFRSELTPVPAQYFRIGFGRKAVPAAVAALQRWVEHRGR